ncbi:MAG TPA: hypothetical protein PKY81_11030 [bacterium]|nr:hypothetical protein [bacterium]
MKLINFFISILLLIISLNSNIYSNQRIIEKHYSTQEFKLAAKIQGRSEEILNEYPILPSEPVAVQEFVFIADNASGLIYKYGISNGNIELLDKFPYAPDSIKQLETSFSDYSELRTYFKESKPFAICLSVSNNNTLLTKDEKFADKIRELDLSGNLLAFYETEQFRFKKNSVPPIFIQKLKEKYYPDIMNRIEKIYYDGSNLFLSAGKNEFVRVYSNFKDYDDVLFSDISGKYNAAPSLREYLESPSLYLGNDNELYSIKQGVARKYQGSDNFELKDVNSEDLKFIGADKDGFRYYWSALEPDFFDPSNAENFIPVIKVFSKSGSIERIVKNDMWTKHYEKYNMSKKYCDYEGNIFFLTDCGVEKFRFDGTFHAEIISAESGITPELIFAAKKFLFVYDKFTGSIYVFENNDSKDFFKFPITDNNFFITSFDKAGDNLYCAGFLKQTRLAKKNKISAITVKNGGYRTDDIFYSQNNIEKIKVSPSGNLIAIVETADKTARRIRIADSNGLNSYIVFSTKNNLTNIFWIDGTTLCFLENNKNVILCSSLKNKSKIIFSEKTAFIKSIYPASEKEIFAVIDKELSISQKNNAAQNSKNRISNESNNKTLRTFELTKNGEPSDINIYSGVNENNILKTIPENNLNSEDADGTAGSEKGFLYKLIFFQHLSSSAMDSMPSNNYSIEFVKILKSPEITNISYCVDKNQLLYSINNRGTLEWHFDNKPYAPFLKGGCSYIEPLIADNEILCIHRIGSVSTLYKYIFENYVDNSSFVSGSFKLKNSSEKFSGVSYVATNISDNIGSVNYKGEFSLINPVPAYQELWLISENYAATGNTAKYIGFNASVKFDNIPAIKTSVSNYAKGALCLKNKDYSGAERLFLSFVAGLDDSDTKLKNAGRRKLMTVYYKKGDYKESAALAEKIGFQSLNSTYKIIAANSYIELGDYRRAYEILDLINEPDLKYMDFIEFQKIRILSYVSGKTFISTARQSLTGRFKNSNPAAYNLLFRDIMKRLNIFE